MPYEIGELVLDENGESGIVIIKWDNGDISENEDDETHPGIDSAL